MKAMLSLYTQEQVAQQEDAVAQLAEYQAEYATELNTIKLQHEQALTVHDHQALSRSQDQQSRHEALLAERQAEHERQLERFHAMHAEAMTDGQLLHAEQLCELKDGHDLTLAHMVSHACTLQRYILSVAFDEEQMSLAQLLFSTVCCLDRPCPDICYCTTNELTNQPTNQGKKCMTDALTRETTVVEHTWAA